MNASAKPSPPSSTSASEYHGGSGWRAVSAICRRENRDPMTCPIGGVGRRGSGRDGMVRDGRRRIGENSSAASAGQAKRKHAAPFLQKGETKMQTKYPNFKVGEGGNAFAIADGRNIMSANRALIAASALLGILLASSTASAFSPVNADPALMLVPGVFVQVAASPFLRGAPEAPAPSLRSCEEQDVERSRGVGHDQDRDRKAHHGLGRISMFCDFRPATATRRDVERLLAYRLLHWSRSCSSNPTPSLLSAAAVGTSRGPVTIRSFSSFVRLPFHKGPIEASCYGWDPFEHELGEKFSETSRPDT